MNLCVMALLNAEKEAGAGTEAVSWRAWVPWSKNHHWTPGSGGGASQLEAAWGGTVGSWQGLGDKGQARWVRSRGGAAMRTLDLPVRA